MIFTLQALNAEKGDSLILSWGPPNNIRHILIDGGPNTVFNNSLEPRLQELRAGHKLSGGQSLPFEICMVSHIDDDHINGILDLFDAMEKAHPAVPYRIKTLWHNSFDEILGNGSSELKSRLASFESELSNLPPELDHSVAIVASVGQGRKLRAAAEARRILLNGRFRGLVMAKKGMLPVTFPGGLKLHIIGPNEARLNELLTIWDKDVKKNPSTAAVAAFVDKSVANLSSIVVVAEFEGNTMLLTGDARGDDILAGLESAGFLTDQHTGTVHFDVLKMPHHGSDRNITEDFLHRVTADHYIFSANGEHDNPDKPTIDMLGRARPGESFLLHFTNETMFNKKKRDIGAELKAALADHNLTHNAIFRQPGELGVSVHLIDEMPF
jgi:hypothetical protein